MPSSHRGSSRVALCLVLSRVQRVNYRELMRYIATGCFAHRPRQGCAQVGTTDSKNVTKRLGKTVTEAFQRQAQRRLGASRAALHGWWQGDVLYSSARCAHCVVHTTGHGLASGIGPSRGSSSPVAASPSRRRPAACSLPSPGISARWTTTVCRRKLAEARRTTGSTAGAQIAWHTLPGTARPLPAVVKLGHPWRSFRGEIGALHGDEERIRGRHGSTHRLRAPPARAAASSTRSPRQTRHDVQWRCNLRYVSAKQA